MENGTTLFLSGKKRLSFHFSFYILMLSKWFKTNACFGFNHQLQLSSFAAVKSQRKEKQKSMISGRFFSYIFVH